MKCLVISNMMASIPAYNAYAKKVLEPKMDPAVLKQILDMESDRQDRAARLHEDADAQWYEQHILRRPFAQWPEPVLRAREKMNRTFYVTMQGPSEMGATIQDGFGYWHPSRLVDHQIGFAFVAAAES